MYEAQMRQAFGAASMLIMLSTRSQIPQMRQAPGAASTHIMLLWNAAGAAESPWYLVGKVELCGGSNGLGALGRDKALKAGGDISVKLLDFGLAARADDLAAPRAADDLRSLPHAQRAC